MARRSSARLASRSSTPKRVSLSHDAPTRTPRTVPDKLSALMESDEMPGAFPDSASPAPNPPPVNTATAIPLSFIGTTTPKRGTPVKPTEEEMHPEKHHQSTAKPLEEARWLGFSNMNCRSEPPKPTSRLAQLQATPTRGTNASVDISSPKHQFSFWREQSLELSPAAKQLMSEKREEAARIREQMVASGESAQHVAAEASRRIATPKSKKGRFSDMHKEEFSKMDSIASHPSARRTAVTPTKTPIRVQTQSQRVQHIDPTPTKSLKRSPSKAELDSPHQANQSSLPRPSSRPLFAPQPTSQLPRTISTKHTSFDTDTHSSPAKRVKRSAGQDVSIARPCSSGSDQARPVTPVAKKLVEYPDLSTVASPTQSSMARATSVKATKSTGIPLPALTRSPSKPAIHTAVPQATKPSTPLLSRSPSKASLFSRPNHKQAAEVDSAHHSPLLQRSPLKGSVFRKHEPAGEKGVSRQDHEPLLSRSPLKASFGKGSGSETKQDVPAPSTPLLNRSPFKASFIKSSDAVSKNEASAPSTPLLARSPVRIALPVDDVEEASTKIPSKSTGSNILGRFNLLRPSPMKSILRSPQRLYSDDPAQVAAGTHLATPPKINKKLLMAGAATASVHKRVEFSSSTKDRYERAMSELSSTPTKSPAPCRQPKSANAIRSETASSLYPRLPSPDDMATFTPQKRRQTATPGDFTFRAGEHSIVFGQSPNAPTSATSSKRTPTIRHVSAEPKVPTYPVFTPLNVAKKRKFDFENQEAVESKMAGEASDKENGAGDIEERPSKRVKQSEPSQSPHKAAVRRPTLGVKPKKSEKDPRKPSVISRARLNALSQPKRRV